MSIFQGTSARVFHVVRKPGGRLEIRGAKTHNLRDVDVDIPLGVLVVVTGVAGSGKSSLIYGSVAGRDGVVSVDQAAIRGSRRSNPATYTGLLDPIRNAFARANGVKPALFSANSEGACPACNGAGVIYTDLSIMATIATTCVECEGKRFDASVLEYHLGGRDISEVLAMSVSEAREFFGSGAAATPAAHAILNRLADVGLGYISLGQPLTTLSGGERQRLKLATHMGEKGGVYVLDEPSIGLHQRDNKRLIKTLMNLRDLGNTVIVVEHDEEIMRSSDHIIDIGPGAGIHGGEIVASGHLNSILKEKDSVTAKYLSGEMKIDVPKFRRRGNGKFISVKGAKHNNLKNIDIDIPLGAFVCITGVSGSGKSSLVNDILYNALAKKFYNAMAKPGAYDSIEGIDNIDKVIIIDQSSIGRTPRSNPATYTGVFDHIRDIFAMSRSKDERIPKRKVLI